MLKEKKGITIRKYSRQFLIHWKDDNGNTWRLGKY
jgi:hypothetical protein